MNEINYLHDQACGIFSTPTDTFIPNMLSVDRPGVLTTTRMSDNRQEDKEILIRK